MSWCDDIQIDEFEREDGITLDEKLAAITDAHYAGQCDPMTCPICNEGVQEGDIEDVDDYYDDCRNLPPSSI